MLYLSNKSIHMREWKVNDTGRIQIRYFNVSFKVLEVSEDLILIGLNTRGSVKSIWMLCDSLNRYSVKNTVLV